MADNKNINVPSEEEDDMNIITLQSMDGKESIDFELLDVVPYEDEEYIVIVPVEVSEIDNVEIYRIQADPETDEETYVGLETQEEVDAVYAEFKKRNADNFDFAD